MKHINKQFSHSTSQNLYHEKSKHNFSSFSCLFLATCKKTDVARVEVKFYSQKSFTRNANTLAGATVQTFGQEYNLRLKSPEKSVFAKNFKLSYEVEDTEGKLKLHHVTPTRRNIEQLERSILVDPDMQAVVRLHKIGNEYRMSGVIGDMTIDHTDGSHYVTKSNHEEHINDYVTVDGLEGRKISAPSKRAVSYATPELYYVLDYDISKALNFDDASIMTYLSVMTHSVNHRYATLSDPRIHFYVVGARTTKTLSAQPFVQQNIVNDGVDTNAVLKSFSEWVKAEGTRIPKHDLAPLLTSKTLYYKQSDNSYRTIGGLAYLRTACLWGSTQSYSTSVTHEKGGAYTGIFTLAHELAHNLGASHDGDGESTSCPWADGYIMSYEGWGKPNKYTFSSCSAASMKARIDSAGGLCLRKIEGSSHWAPTSTFPGETMNPDTQCVNMLDNPEATVYPQQPDEHCNVLKCMYRVSETSYRIAYTGRPPLDGTPCGDNGKCFHGKCKV